MLSPQGHLPNFQSPLGYVNSLKANSRSPSLGETTKLEEGHKYTAKEKRIIAIGFPN